ncbi:MAG: hypothetical protein LBR13_00645, partial [Dysgonamonadaceae bacterium]|nr:hypothetical protein [Dysgonamonadaceae bacterium]
MKTITEQALMCKKYINDEKKGNFFYKELKELVDICQGKRINLKFEDITDSQRNEVIRIAKECGIDVVQQSVKKKQGTHIEQSPENRSETKIEIVQAVVNKPQKSTIEISITSIRKNPYRILGVLAGASIKEITKQANNLKKYLAADAEPPTDYSFSDLDGLNRTTEDIETAAANLNLDEDRMLSALFWFWKGNEITDEPALEAIKSGDLQQAYDIWGRLTQGNEVTAKNCSAFHNYSVC